MKQYKDPLFWSMQLNALLIGLILIAIYAGVCEAEEINPEFDLRTTTIIVHWFETESELQAELDDDELAGLSECEWRPDFNISFCELWLVRPVDTEDAYNFDTIGHEFYHAVTGSFHDE